MKRFYHRAVGFYWGRGIADDTPALTYYLVLSLAPFALGLAAIVAITLGGQLQPEDIAEEVGKFLPVSIRDDVTNLVMTTRRDSTKLIIASVVAMLWTTSAAVGVVERVLFRTSGSRRFPMLIGRIRNIGIGAALAILLIVAALAASMFAGAAQYVGIEASWSTRIFSIGNFASSVVFCALIFRYTPRDFLRWRASFAGALPAAVVMQLAPLLVGVYFNAFTSTQTASIFVSIAVVLLGCYMLAQGLLIGAGVAGRVHSHMQGLSSKQELDASMREAL